KLAVADVPGEVENCVRANVVDHLANGSMIKQIGSNCMSTCARLRRGPRKREHLGATRGQSSRCPSSYKACRTCDQDTQNFTTLCFQRRKLRPEDRCGKYIACPDGICYRKIDS